MNNEYKKQCQEFEKDFALECINIHYKYENEYPNFMYVGAAWAKKQAYDNYMEAKRKAFEKDVQTLRRRLEIIHFGVEGRPNRILQLGSSEKEETNAPTPELENKSLRAAFVNMLSKISALF